jgi:hypothetical protein
MANNLYELYLDYKDRDIDDNFIIKAYDYIASKEQDLLSYIQDFSISDEDSTSFGLYSNENKTITINKKRINENEVIAKNTLGLSVIKHEIEHAKNLKKLEEFRDDIETKMILYSLRSYAIASGLDATKMNKMDLVMLALNTKINHEIDPGERIAYIKSWKYVVNLLKNQNKTKELLDARTMLYSSYIRGYNDNRYYLDCPTYSFLFETNQLQDLKLLRNRIVKKDYSFDTRLLYGLPITYQEYNQDILDKSRLKKVRKK